VVKKCGAAAIDSESEVSVTPRPPQIPRDVRLRWQQSRAGNDGLAKSLGVADMSLLRRRCCDVTVMIYHALTNRPVNALNSKCGIDEAAEVGVGF
jgi:hypothetical protein